MIIGNTPLKVQNSEVIDTRNNEKKELRGTHEVISCSRVARVCVKTQSSFSDEGDAQHFTLIVGLPVRIFVLGMKANTRVN